MAPVYPVVSFIFVFILITVSVLTVKFPFKCETSRDFAICHNSCLTRNLSGKFVALFVLYIPIFEASCLLIWVNTARMLKYAQMCLSPIFNTGQSIFL